MGFQKTIILDNGLTVKDAYIKVTNISGDKSALTFNLGAFITKEDAEGGKQPLKYYYNSFKPNLEEGNFISQVYEFAKGLDDFKDATDC